ncbi:MAG: photosynthetic reaction center cytochrome c subunit family protein [Vicinamibacterales bacterium]
MTRRSHARRLAGCGVLVLAATVATRAQQPTTGQAAAPAGPLAPEKYHDIQVLTDVPADQLDLTMRYFSAATGLECRNCHVRDEATGAFAYDQDTRTKTTARRMIKMVQSVNAGDFGVRINCATCHAGHNQPTGLPPAQMMTPEEVAAAAARAARQAGPGPARGGGGPGGRAGGRGGQPAGPSADEVLNAWVDALGGRAAVAGLQSLVLSGTLVSRAGESMPFTIEEKGDRYRETTRPSGGAVSVGFDGTSGWTDAGGRVSDLAGFPLQQALVLADLDRALTIKDRYPDLRAGRSTRLPPPTAGADPIEATMLQGASPAGVTERLYFETSSGLLLRRQVITRTPLNGSLVETIDYADYRAVNGLKVPHRITRNDWQTLDTLTVSDVKVNTAIPDARFTKPGR